jgi:hypothetical protein
MQKQKIYIESLDVKREVCDRLPMPTKDFS